ncbi:MAG: DegT/DnrJ/EryC1/StrS aminotransferase family protein [Nostocaceae cyanobacterium]|nr:DegT/DnrJ/EryC1/StrS aminotransferase family protein [Nostocaceae cyanobacterium]
MVKRWEIGSEFDWCNDFVMASGSQTLLPEKYELFSTGTATLFALEKLLNHKPERRLRLHLPSFLCMHFATKLKSIFEVHWYRDLPNQESPDFNSLNTLPGDLVLAVNLFGIREGKVWQDWLLDHDDIILIEDHSHDPFSPWASQSTAHYAIASLRKTLPVPDGGMIWSPQNLQLPKPFSSKSFGAEKRLTAMLLKQAYLSGANISKDVYRQLELESDEELDRENNCASSSFTAHIISCLKIAEFRQSRETNVRQFINFILTERHSILMPLFHSWNPGYVPLNSIIVCQSKDIRDSLRKYLISQNIFPAIHWQQNILETSSNDPLAIDLSNRILTIPTDQRYSLDDIARIATTITEFLQTNDNTIASSLI